MGEKIEADIEITEEMIIAGTGVLSVCLIGSDPSDVARELVENIFLAMLKASSSFQAEE